MLSTLATGLIVRNYHEDTVIHFGKFGNNSEERVPPHYQASAIPTSGANPCYQIGSRIIPFVEYGNNINVFITDIPCKMGRDVFQVFANYGDLARIEPIEFIAPRKYDDVKSPLTAFENDCGGRNKVVYLYDMIILTRHDIAWKKTILSSINFNCSNVNVAFPNFPTYYHDYDVLHRMPGSCYENFSASLNKCFTRGLRPAAHGHFCKKVANQIGGAGCLFNPSTAQIYTLSARLHPMRLPI